MRFLLFFLLTCSVAFSKEDKVYLSPHGVKSLEWALELINASHQSIEISNTFLGGEVGLQILQAVEKRMASSSIRVHLIFHPLYVDAKIKATLQRLATNYPKRFFYLFSSEIPSTHQEITSTGNHVKLMVFDEKYFIVGGTNFFDQGCTVGLETPEKEPPSSIFAICSAARDSDVVGQGEVALDLRNTFFQLYAFWEKYQSTKIFELTLDHLAHWNHYFPISKKMPIANIQAEEMVEVTSMKRVFGVPFDIPNKIATEYISLISQAKESLFLGNLYFHPHDELMEALISAVNRGVNMQAITNGSYDGVTPKITTCFAWANRMSYTPLFYGRYYYFWQYTDVYRSPLKKTKIYEYLVKDTIYHKKTMVIDDRYLVIGSFNLGLKSRIGDFELILVIDSPKVAKKMLEVYEIDKEHAKAITPEQANIWYFDPWLSYVGAMQKKISGYL